MDNDPMLWAFQHFFHMDKANAAIHCAPTRFSPITFRIAAVLAAAWHSTEDYSPELNEVLSDAGAYELDGGR